MTDISDLELMLKIINQRVEETKREIRKGAKHLREQEKRECWSGRCLHCDAFNEVERSDVWFESGFFGSITGFYTKCLDCGDRVGPVRKLTL